jgi:hypothetical protein
VTWVLFAARSLVRLGVITALWGWFAVPLGFPALSLAHVAGLWTLASVARPGRFPAIQALVTRVEARESDGETPPLLASAASVLLDLWALAAGWLLSGSL